MIKLKNPAGGETWVADNRLDEYLALGFVFPPEPKKTARPAAKPKAQKQK